MAQRDESVVERTRAAKYFAFRHQVCYESIWDLLNTEFFTEHHKNLNGDGLFDNYNDAVAFKKHYIELLQKGLVGDGDVDLYVCCIYEVPNEYFIKS
ncbi:MAG: hypothetical protein IKK70_06630 [Clostridia bacterium]|nr:hypothetical protein [Clostridia bacterium]